MGSRLRKLRRSMGAATSLPMVGTGSAWKEDLLALGHLARCLGFQNSELSPQVWQSEKRGHFVPGIVITSGNVEHAFTLGDVPGTQAAAANAWREFRASVDPASFGDIFRASQIADLVVVERLCKSLEAAGITIPAKAKADAPVLAPVGA